VFILTSDYIVVLASNRPIQLQRKINS